VEVGKGEDVGKKEGRRGRGWESVGGQLGRVSEEIGDKSGHVWVRSRGNRG